MLSRRAGAWRADVAGSAWPVERLAEMLRDLQVAAALARRERDDPLHACGRFPRVSLEERVDDVAGARLDREQLDAHRPSRVVVAADDPRLLQHPDEHPRVVALVEHGCEPVRLDDATRITDGAVHQAQQIGCRHPAEREAPERGGVRVAREEDGVARSPVPSRATHHLHVALERVREVHERDEAHVGLVDPHPERGRRDDDGEVACDEGVLHARPLVRFETGVVVLRADPVPPQRAGDLLARAPGAGVDDRGSSVDRA